MTFEELQEKIIVLRADLSKYSIRDIYGYAFTEMTRIDSANPEKMSLHSPFKQVSYIASLAMSVVENTEKVELDKNAWIDTCAKVNEIYNRF